MAITFFLKQFSLIVFVFFQGISFREPAFTLKHLLKSCVELMHSVLKWLKNNADDHFQLIQINAITVFVNLVTDSIADHLLDTANEILKMTVGTSDSEKLQEILHSHVLSLCFFIVDEEVNRADKYDLPSRNLALNSSSIFRLSQMILQ